MNKLIAVLPGAGNVVTVPCSPHGETRLEALGALAAALAGGGGQ